MQFFGSKSTGFVLLAPILLVVLCQEVAANAKEPDYGCNDAEDWDIFCHYDRTTVYTVIAVLVIFLLLLVLFLFTFLLCLACRCCCFKKRDKAGGNNLVRNMTYVECPQWPKDAQEPSSSPDGPFDNPYRGSPGPSSFPPPPQLQPQPYYQYVHPLNGSRQHGEYGGSKSKEPF